MTRPIELRQEEHRGRGRQGGGQKRLNKDGVYWLRKQEKFKKEYEEQTCEGTGNGVLRMGEKAVLNKHSFL